MEPPTNNDNHDQQTSTVSQTSVPDDKLPVDEHAAPEKTPATASVDTPTQPERIETASVAPKPDTDTASKDIADVDMDLGDDFEEISDGELEEEARIRGLGDALGVDWASLVEESRAIAREKSTTRNTTAKQRWQPHHILLDVGVSLKMAGTQFGTDILRDAYAKLDQEERDQNTAVAAKPSVKIESLPPNEPQLDIVKKEQSDDDVEEEKPKSVDVKSIKIESSAANNMAYHPIACVQVAMRHNTEKRRSLVFNATGLYSRALSARRDVQMRRQLCGLPGKPVGNWAASSAGATSATSKALGFRSIALELFQKALGEVR